MELVFATNNGHKLAEVSEILGPEFRLATPADLGITEDIPETQDTLEGNALQKARYLYDRTGKNCFADDTGLEVDALGGEPGVRSARYAGDSKRSEDNMELLLSKLEHEADRNARFRTAICLILDGMEYSFEGIVTGTIRRERSGNEGFGYDPVFLPDGCDVTFAEMPPTEKNRISHRGRAVEKLAEFLKTTER
jgi:XTP/dITP diphosphohydrolase